MILIQHTEAMNSRVAGFRQHYAKVSADKLEDSLSKFGAILAQGIIDAGHYWALYNGNFANKIYYF